MLSVKEIYEDRYMYRDMKKIEIFMSPMDVHVNRIPRTGVVVDAIYSEGKFFNASLDKASIENEQNAVIVRDEKGRDYMFVQISGLIARRIVSYVRAGKEVEIGQRMGLIKFGSRLDVYLPPETNVTIMKGRKSKIRRKHTWQIKMSDHTENKALEEMDREILADDELEEKRRRNVVFLPNAITTLAMFSGFFAIMKAMEGDFKLAVWAIFAAGYIRHDGRQGGQTDKVDLRFRDTVRLVV